MQSGCATRRQDNSKFQQQTATANQLLADGQAQQVAQIYQRLAQTKSSDQNQFRLLAVEAFLQSGNETDAQRYLDSINANDLSSTQLNVFKLLTGQLYLNAADAEQALERFRFITPAKLNNRHKISYYQSLAFAYALKGQLIDSANAKIALSELPDQAEQQQKNMTAIIETLGGLDNATLSNLESTATGNLGGWAALTLLLKSNRIGSTSFTQVFSQWQQRYPTHPGNTIQLEAYQAPVREPFQLPQAIAILLPESGAYAQASAAIKAGFMAASYNPDASAFQPSIKFYDTSTSEIQTLYQHSINNGAELIIGPLQKNNIIRLAELPELSTPILALNRIPDLVKDKLYQFGLSPEDEAEQIVTQALKDGHNKALILVPDTALGQRIANTIDHFWQLAGGIILEAQSYNQKNSDHSHPIKQLLNLNESLTRSKKIRRLFPSIKYTPRRRHDVDAIFLAGRPRDARLLNPQLQFYRATRVPIYATSQIYAGLPNPSQDIDLNGITFCDTPWLFNDSYQGQLSMYNQKNNWQQFPANYLRLFALGIDAFSLLPHLATMATNYYPGATGNLTLSADNHIKRELVCAKFSEGLAHPKSFNENTTAIDTNATITRPY